MLKNQKNAATPEKRTATQVVLNMDRPRLPLIPYALKTLLNAVVRAAKRMVAMREAARVKKKASWEVQSGVICHMEQADLLP